MSRVKNSEKKKTVPGGSTIGKGGAEGRTEPRPGVSEGDHFRLREE